MVGGLSALRHRVLASVIALLLTASQALAQSVAVAEVAIAGLPDGIPADAILARLEQRQGAVYDKTRLVADRTVVTRALQDQGWLEADAKVADTAMAGGRRLAWTVKPREIYGIEAVKVPGLGKEAVQEVLDRLPANRETPCTRELRDRLAEAVAAKLDIHVLFLDLAWKTSSSKRTATLTFSRRSTPSGPADSELKTMMCDRGKLVIDDPFSAATMDGDWRGFQPGEWKLEDKAVRVTARPGEHSPYRIRKLDLTDLIIQVSFRLDGVDHLGFGFDNDRGQHLMACNLHPGSLDLQRHGIIGRDRKDDAIDQAKMEVAPETWHTLVWEIHGTEMLASVDGKWVTYGQVDGIDCYKTYLAFFTSANPGKWAWVAHMKIWQATPKPDWEKSLKPRVLAYTAKPH